MKNTTFRNARELARGLLLGAIRTGFAHWFDDAGPEYGLFELDIEDWRQLMRHGSLPLGRLEGRHRPFGRFGPCLIYRAGTGDFLDAPGVDCVHDPLQMSALVQSMRLAYHAEFGLDLVTGSTLESLLRQHRGVLGRRATIALPQDTYRLLTGKRSYYGRCWVCPCGEPGCGAAACWIEAGTPMLWCSMVGGGLVELVVYPRLLPIEEEYPRIVVGGDALATPGTALAP